MTVKICTSTDERLEEEEVLRNSPNRGSRAERLQTHENVLELPMAGR